MSERKNNAAQSDSAGLREALIECVATLALVEHPARLDPVHGAEVKALGDRIGYGALMSSASASWRKHLEADGLSGGEFVSGPCHLSVTKALAKARAALAANRPPAECGTTAARWRANGQPDPHGKRYDCERAKLPHGDMTDDELANALFLKNYDIGIITAAKERIRWLSRQLEHAAAHGDDARKQAFADAMNELDKLRTRAATDFRSPNCQGQRGVDRTDAFFDAYHAIRRLSDESKAEQPT